MCARFNDREIIMFDELEDKPKQQDHGFELLQELGKNTPEAIRKQRTHERISIKSKVIIQSGNTSQLLDFKIQGITGDISPGGSQMLMPLPLYIGDIYRITFDQSHLKLPMTFARCIRCRLIREDAYEVGFTFFSALNIDSAIVDSSSTAA